MTGDSKSRLRSSRYGRKIRTRVAKIEEKQRAPQICPKCGREAKRVAPGVYECPRCGKFTGGAYFV